MLLLLLVKEKRKMYNKFKYSYTKICMCYFEIERLLFKYAFDCYLNPLPQKSRVWITLRKKSLENIAGKGENAVNKHYFYHPFLGFFFFSFLILTKTNFNFAVTCIL